MTTQSRKEELWIGLVEVAGKPANAVLSGHTAAFATFVTFARDARSFYKCVRTEAERLDLRHIKTVWSEPLRTRLQNYDIDTYLLRMAEDLKPEHGGVFGKFHVWDEE